MQDIFYGIVYSIINADTFIIKVMETEQTNQKDYYKWERVKIINLDTVGLKPLRHLRGKINLEKAIQWKKLSCAVKERDSNGRIVADIKIIDK